MVCLTTIETIRRPTLPNTLSPLMYTDSLVPVANFLFKSDGQLSFVVVCLPLVFLPEG